MLTSVPYPTHSHCNHVENKANKNTCRYYELDYQIHEFKTSGKTNSLFSERWLDEGIIKGNLKGKISVARGKSTSILNDQQLYSRDYI